MPLLFPQSTATFATPPSLASRGIALRAAHGDDMAWLRTLYGESRAAELAPIPWPNEMKRSFLDSQFDLQHRHFVGQFSAGSFLIVESARQPIGRLYLSNGDPEFVVDICIASASQNSGIGTSLLQAILDRSSTRGAVSYTHLDVYKRQALVRLENYQAARAMHARANAPLVVKKSGTVAPDAARKACMPSAT